MPSFALASVSAALLGIVLAPVAIAVVVWLIVLEKKRVDERRASLAQLAHRLGFTFDPEKDRDHDERFAQFAVFRRGHSRVAFNTLRGSIPINGASHPVVMGDYRYKITTHNGKSSSTHTYRLSYVIVRFPRPGVPDLLIRPEGVFDKLGQALGFDDIDFEDIEFSRMFVVKSSDRRFAYDVCHPRMIEWLKEQAGRFPAIDIEHGHMCLVRDKRRCTPGGFEENLAYAQEFIDRWPDHALRELGFTPKREDSLT